MSDGSGTPAPAPGAPAPAPGATPARPAANGDGWLRDNLEAVAVAIIMALLIRHFCVEAFRIPTSSMEPTLLGQLSDRSGDRILVNKVGYFFADPARWQVVVFKYPLNRSRNYIKRLIGQPGETIDIRGGDIWVNGAIARKPDSVQGDLWRRVFTLDAAVDLARRNVRLDSAVRGGDQPGDNTPQALATSIGFRDGADVARIVDEHLEADARGRTEPAWIALPEKGADGGYLAHDERYNEVGDLRLRATLTCTPGAAGALWLRIGPHDSRFRIRLPIGEGRAAVWHSTDAEGLGTPLDLAPAVRLPAGRPVDVEAAHVDGVVTVHVDGAEVVRYEYEPPAAPYDGARWEGTPAIGLEDTAVAVFACTADRDIHYLRENPERLPLHVPADHYLMLGDNSGSSKDGRLWHAVEFDLVDGTTIRADGDTNARGDDGERQYILDPDRGTLDIVDVTGRWWRLTRDQVRNFDSPRTEPAPFVPRDNLVGRAFFIFYPLGRVRFVH